MADLIGLLGKELRVTFVTLNYRPSIGGAQDHVEAVATRLVARGHVVTVLTTDALRTPLSTDPGRIARGRDTFDGVEVHRFPVGRRVARLLRLGAKLVDRGRTTTWQRDPFSRPWFAGPLAVRFGWATWRARRIDDVVVACEAPFLTLVAPPLLRPGARSAVVAMPLLHLGQGEPDPLLLRALRRSDRISTSTAVEREALVALGVDRARVRIIPPGTDPSRFADRNPSEARLLLDLPDRPTVGYLGRLVPYKGIDVLLEAVALLWTTNPEVNVLVAGSTSSWTGLDELLDRARLLGGDRLILRADFDAADKSTLLSACDVVACPSRDESFGMVTVEAWAARRPVVAADIAAVRDVVEEGMDALLIPVGDASALAEAISTLLRDPTRARLFGAAGRRKVEQSLGWESIVDRWEQLLAEIGPS